MDINDILIQKIISGLQIWSVFLISIIISSMYQKRRIREKKDGTYIKNNNKIFCFFWTVAIIIGPSLLIGLREYSVGADTYNYVLSFMRDGGDILGLKFDLLNILYTLLKYITYNISNGNPTFFLFSFAFITLFLLVRALDKFNERISFPFALFIYYSLIGMQLFNQSRQMLALSIVLYGLPYLLDKKNFKYTIIVAVASLVHFTAIFCLLFVLIRFQDSRYYKVKKWFYNSLWLMIPLFLPYLISLMGNVLPEKYVYYTANVSMTNLGFGLILSVIPVFLPILILRKYLRSKDSELLTRISMLVFPLRLAGYYSYYLMRMQYYSLIFMPILISIGVGNIKSSSYRLLSKAIVIGILVVFYIVNYMYLDAGQMFPYKSIINM